MPIKQHSRGGMWQLDMMLVHDIPYPPIVFVLRTLFDDSLSDSCILPDHWFGNSA